MLNKWISDQKKKKGKKEKKGKKYMCVHRHMIIITFVDIEDG